jgi:xanthine dehydrogenase accessory factor
MQILEKLLELEKQNKAYILATVVRATGSVPGKPGFKMIIEADGNTLGTIGGGAIERRVKKQALELLKQGANLFQEYLLSDSEEAESSHAEKVPMMCSGKVWIFFEVNGGKTPVYIFGGGHVGSALTYFLRHLPFHVTLVDNREGFANSDKNPGADDYIFEDYIAFTTSFQPPAGAYFVVLTHGHEYDYDIAKNILKRNLNIAYLGIIASRVKAKKITEQLQNELNGNADVEKLHTPIGLKIGGDSADEIALAIAAEIQSIKYEGTEKK